MRTPENPVVVVVGAGPAGLTAAVTLARQDVPTLLVERRRELSSLPRATVISTRSMEVFRSWGLEDRIQAGAVDVEWQLWMCATLATAAGGTAHAVGYPTRAQSAVLSPTGPACVPQDHLEPVLLAHLRSLPAAEVELGTEVTDVADGPAGVRVALRDTATGATRVVAARYVVAADGAHSAVRRAVGITMHGRDDLAVPSRPPRPADQRPADRPADRRPADRRPPVGRGATPADGRAGSVGDRPGRRRSPVVLNGPGC